VNACADSIRVVHPLFQAEGGGSIPTSALQFHMGWMNVKVAVILNHLWHSSLPVFTGLPEKCKAIGAVHDGLYHATAIWSHPVARKLNWTGRYELRRFAIGPEAPKNTASRMLRVMRLLVARKFPDVSILMSYQDKDSHMGTIYRAAGWLPVSDNEVPRDGWHTRQGRAATQTNAAKVRWEYQLRRIDRETPKIS